MSASTRLCETTRNDCVESPASRRKLRLIKIIVYCNFNGVMTRCGPEGGGEQRKCQRTQKNREQGNSKHGVKNF